MKHIIIEHLLAGLRFTVLFFAILGLVGSAVGAVIYIGKIAIDKQIVVDCLKAQDQAIEYQNNFYVTKEFWSTCNSRGIIINVKDIR